MDERIIGGTSCVLVRFGSGQIMSRTDTVLLGKFPPSSMIVICAAYPSGIYRLQDKLEFARDRLKLFIESIVR